jgi:hypothetical protein
MPPTASALRPAAPARRGRRDARSPWRDAEPTSETRGAAATDQLCLLTGLDMHKLALTIASLEELCDWCVEHGPKGCPACTQRRRKAVRLEAAGLSTAEIAAEMDVTPERVERLLEQEHDRRETETFKVTHVANAELRKAFELRRAQDHAFSAAELARLACFSGSSHVERELGLIPTSDTIKNGVFYPGRIKSTVSIDNAERLLRGLGFDPWEIQRLLDGEELI